MGGRLSVGGRRALVEDDPFLALPQVERALEGLFFLPARHELLFEVRKADSLDYGFKHCALRAPGAFRTSDQAMFLRIEIRRYAPSMTTIGERSKPDIGGSHRRMGARTGSVIRYARRVTALVGYGLIHEKTIRTNITMMNA